MGILDDKYFNEIEKLKSDGKLKQGFKCQHALIYKNGVILGHSSYDSILSNEMLSDIKSKVQEIGKKYANQ